MRALVMPEDLVKKKSIRAGHRGVVTRRVAEADRLLGGDSPESEQVSRLITILEEKLLILWKLDGEILELMEREEDIATEIEEADAHNQGIHDLLLRMQKVSVATSGSGSESTRDPGTGVSGSSTRQARLPKLILLPSNGDMANWLSFWELYDVSVHSNSELTDVQKLSYLKSLVEGDCHCRLIVTVKQ